MEKKTFICDIKGCERPAVYPKREIQVIFTTEQTEGRSCSPYLQLVKLDLCQRCMERILTGHYIWASGAMGHNEYIFPR